MIQRVTGGRLGLPATAALCLMAVLVLWWIGADSEPARLPASPGGGPIANDSAESADSKGVLREVGRGVYESPAGLRFTRGSRQGHRLDHVMTHSRDAPNRAGQHGVFDANDAAGVVAVLDEAYERAITGRDVSTRKDNGRTVHTVDLRRRIGYVGGQSGNQQGHPVAKHIRLVLEDNRVITAYPVVP